MEKPEGIVIKTNDPALRKLLIAIAEADEYLEREWSRITTEVFMATEAQFMAQHGLGE